MRLLDQQQARPECSAEQSGEYSRGRRRQEINCISLNTLYALLKSVCTLDTLTLADLLRLLDASHREEVAHTTSSVLRNVLHHISGFIVILIGRQCLDDNRIP